MTVSPPPSTIECPLGDVCGHQQAILREGFYYMCSNPTDPTTGKRPHGHSPVAFVAGRCAGTIKDYRSTHPAYCGKKARHEEGDRWYCGTHSPKLQEQRNDERGAVRAEEARRRRLEATQELDKKEARNAIVDAAIRWANSPADDEATDALRLAVDSLARLNSRA